MHMFIPTSIYVYNLYYVCVYVCMHARQQLSVPRSLSSAHDCSLCVRELGYVSELSGLCLFSIMWNELTPTRVGWYVRAATSAVTTSTVYQWLRYLPACSATTTATTIAATLLCRVVCLVVIDRTARTTRALSLAGRDESFRSRDYHNNVWLSAIPKFWLGGTGGWGPLGGDSWQLWRSFARPGSTTNYWHDRPT